MYYFENIIEEIENSLMGQIDAGALAGKANLSVYEFRRIFKFITKISFSEYVRKRRLSVAALKLYEGGSSVTELSALFGYDSPSSFSRAFREFHGISPSEVSAGNGNFRLLTRISTEITTSGGSDISYTLVKKGAFTVSGYRGISDFSDTECCERVWQEFYESDIGKTVSEESERIFALYNNCGDTVECIIGEESEKYTDKIRVESSEWACFTLCSTEDAYVNSFYRDMLGQWLSSVNYVRNYSLPNIEVYPADMEEEGFTWQIWIPIMRGDRNE